MKLTKLKLKQLIKEELTPVLKEATRWTPTMPTPWVGSEEHLAHLDAQGEKRVGDAQAMSSDMRKDLMPYEYPAVQLDNDLAFDGMEANIESWTKDALNSGDGDLITELHDFLEELLNKNEDPYRK